MIRALAVAVLALVAVGVAGADHPGDRDEFKVVIGYDLEGTWCTNVLTYNGMEIPWYADTPAMVFVFKAGWCDLKTRWSRKTTGGKYVVRRGGEIDIFFETQSSVREEPLKGLYKIAGDSLTLCYRESGSCKERPVDFESKKGSGHYLLVLKRLKP